MHCLEQGPAPNLGTASSMVALRAEKGRLLCGDPEVVLLPLDSASPVLRADLSSGPARMRTQLRALQEGLCRLSGCEDAASPVLRADLSSGPAEMRSQRGFGLNMKACVGY